MKIRKNLLPESLYGWKCPFKMTPTRIVVHNTANDASADNEVKYMHKTRLQGGKQVSYHYAVDDKEVVQAIEENRNSWNAGDGGKGKGNREGIAIEICYSKSGGDRFTKAELNAVELIVDILKRYGWGIDKVTKHQDYSGKYCPHRTLDLGWDRFLNLIKARMGESKPIEKPAEKPAKPGYNGSSIVDALNSIGVDSSFNNRKRIASINGISNYKGTPDQNVRLLSLFKQGKLAYNGSSNTNTPPTGETYLKCTYKGSSLVDALKSIRYNSSFASRSALARKNGISGYIGSPSQNEKMLNLLKQGKLKA